jgi:hypothetical protein
VVLSILLSSCGLFKKSCTHQEALYELPADAAHKLGKNEFEFKDLNIRAKAVYTTPSEKHSFTMSIKMKKDSAIWISISGFGFEVMRALIDTDSIKIINKLNKTYFVKGIGELRDIIQFDVSLGQLQQLLVGNTPFEANQYTLYNGENQTLFKKETFIKSLLEVSKSYRIAKNSLLQDGKADSLIINYKDFRKIKKHGCIPGDIFADYGSGKTTFQIHYNSVTTTKIDNLPFNVPPKYTHGP